MNQYKDSDKDQWHPPASAKRQTIASNILQMLEGVAKDAERLSEEVEARLRPVMQDGNLAVVGEVEAKLEVYPPLFAEIRSIVLDLQGSLRRIESCIDRTEL
jgi:hypothetical protein